jgi:hypothetical protein
MASFFGNVITLTFFKNGLKSILVRRFLAIFQQFSEMLNLAIIAANL